MTNIEGVDPEFVCANNVKYFNSLEFSSAILVLALSSQEVSSDIDDNGELALLNILAHMYAAISRARVCLSIVLISSDNKPSKLLSDVCSILGPCVKTVDVNGNILHKLHN